MRPLPQIDFQLSRQGGMMKAFEGHWTVQPWEDSLDLDDIVRVGLRVMRRGCEATKMQSDI